MNINERWALFRQSFVDRNEIFCDEVHFNKQLFIDMGK